MLVRNLDLHRERKNVREGISDAERETKTVEADSGFEKRVY